MPRPVTAWVLASVSAVVIAATWWLALQPGAAEAQTAFVTWINDPPQPLAGVLAATNLLLRPVPLAVVALALFGWIMVTARGAARGEVLRAMVLSFALCEVITQVLKRLADQPRPTASIPGLDVHGYPKDPFGNAYPSAHTSVVVGLVAAPVALADLAATGRRRGHRPAGGAQPPVHRGALARRRRRRRGHRAALRVRVLAGGGEMADPPRISHAAAPAAPVALTGRRGATAGQRSARRSAAPQ